MTDCIGIIWHGRGGQGAFTASRILGAAYALGPEHGSALAFPSFGPERRGAPVRAFTKLSPTRVEDRSELSDADYTVYLDRGLMASVPTNGTVLVNSSESIDAPNVLTVDASGIAQDVLGSPIANTARVGALAGAWGGISLESIMTGIDAVMPDRLRAKNKDVVRKAYDAVRDAL